MRSSTLENAAAESLSGGDGDLRLRRARDPHSQSTVNWIVRARSTFLHNRVEDIERVCARIRHLCPQARVDLGHGQMEEGQLEEVMHRFVLGPDRRAGGDGPSSKAGWTSPTPNTIIIDRADRFGLADLYQLRGRVGRGNHKAYAYLMLPRDLLTVGEARKRINAIKQYSALGAGFKIALRDLENPRGRQYSGRGAKRSPDSHRVRPLLPTVASSGRQVEGRKGEDRERK